MARIARSSTPIYQTRNRPVAWSVVMTNPGGIPLDLHGCSIVANLMWSGQLRPLTAHVADGNNGVVYLRGSAEMTVGIPLGQLAELQITLIDSAGMPLDFVWPVVGEVP